MKKISLSTLILVSLSAPFTWAQANSTENINSLNQFVQILGAQPVQGTTVTGDGPCVVDVTAPNASHSDLVLRMYNGEISKTVPDSAIWLSLSPFADLTVKNEDQEFLIQSLQPVQNEDSKLEVASSVKITLRDDGHRLFSAYILNSSIELPLDGSNPPENQPEISHDKFTEFHCVLP